MISPSNSFCLSLSLRPPTKHTHTHTHTKQKRETGANHCRFRRNKSSAVFFLLGDSPASESPKRKNITFRTRRRFEIKNKTSTGQRVCNLQISDKKWKYNMPVCQMFIDRDRLRYGTKRSCIMFSLRWYIKEIS